MKKLFLSLFFVFVFVACDFKLVDDNKQSGLKVDDLLQNMISYKNIIYLISKDTIYYIHNINNKLVKQGKTSKPFTARADYVSIKKMEDNVYILDENKKIHIWKININNELSFVNSIELTHKATNFDVFSDNKIIIVNSDTETELIDIEALTQEQDSYIKFNTIKKTINNSYLQDNIALYTISNLNKLTKYDLRDIKNIREDTERIVPEKINIISSNKKYLFLASDNSIFVYDFSLNKVSSLVIPRVNDFLFDDNYIYLARGLNGISKIDISDVENLRNSKYSKEQNKNYKKILFSEDKKHIIIMLEDEIQMISIDNFKDINSPVSLPSQPGVS